jgi:hypothetical protein
MQKASEKSDAFRDPAGIRTQYENQRLNSIYTVFDFDSPNRSPLFSIRFSGNCLYKCNNSIRMFK